MSETEVTRGVSETDWWALSYAKVHTRLISTTLTKALKGGTDKHRLDLARSALDEARGVVAALERLVQDGPGG